MYIAFKKYATIAKCKEQVSGREVETALSTTTYTAHFRSAINKSDKNKIIDRNNDHLKLVKAL